MFLTKDSKACLATFPVLTQEDSLSGAASPEAAPGRSLHRYADRNSDVGIPAIEQVIAVVNVRDVDVVSVVPVIPPVFWPWVNEADPIAAVLEAGISAHNEESEAGDAETMILTKVSAETVIRNAVAVVASALLPGAVVGVPAL